MRFEPRALLKARKRRACVLGLGRSGLAAARLLGRKGFKVFASDVRPRKELRPLAAKLPAGSKWEAGGHTDRVLDCHFAVKSPGMPHRAPILQKLKEKGIPVFSELEVALAFSPPLEIVAVTGTNGKTTTANMAAAVFKAAHRRTHLYGNVGEPLAGALPKLRKGDTLVVEVSSYQLEDSQWFRPDAAVILNVTSDHIDHHGSMQAYLQAKARVFRQQDRACACVFNSADALTVSLARGCRARKLFFGREPTTRTSAWMEGGKIQLRLPGGKKASSIAPPRLPGRHNLDNAMAAALLAAARGVQPSAVAKAFKSFKGVEHRIEDCGKLKGLWCFNDSKGTNVDSTLAALESLGTAEYLPKGQDKAILLILGGLPKGGGFRALRPLVERYVKAVLTIGSAAPTIEEDLQGVTHVFPCENLETAVRVAFQIGQKGELLLLSPACASFDQFKDFEDRGRRFKEHLKKAGKGA